MRRWLPAYILLAAIWGNSFFFIKNAVQELHPLQVTFARMVIGATALLVACAVGRKALPRDPRLWGHWMVASVVLTTLPFTLFAYGEQYVSSVVAAIWNATTPSAPWPSPCCCAPRSRRPRRWPGSAWASPV